ncbi:DUF1176 domain-containing protein [Stakelama sp. CBK3Z-3]|uniref:DUF1176 domain-containing protein n=1 Tax=Stakelama flava TaxID=2860338 RepID=A0ABS6XMM7_9SPHN|nr:DUF1176 domain-containing protein [Stakelama flava]MBW4331048.1 DUF1176 domain-containing protein [Stakelama flava]
MRYIRVMIALAALALMSFSQPAEVRSFGSWTVSCNDRMRCVAMETAVPAGKGSLTRASMRITRDGAGGRTTVEIWPDHPVAKPVTISMGRAVVYRGRVRGDVVRLIGEDAERAAHAATSGPDRSFVIRTHDGGYVGKVALSGLEEAMRYMDQVQGRSAIG